MWELLNEQLEPESELVLDITHGFRHQPMLLAAMVVLLSYLKQFRQVSLYYGALDMQSIPPRTEAQESQQGQVSVRVLRIDVFPELLEYIRRIGVLQITGDYESLGKYILRDQGELGELRELRRQLEDIAFKERANLSVQGDEIDKFVQQLNQWEPEDALRGTFKPILIEELRKRMAPTPWERMALRADEADKHHDYLTACTLLWEAIVSVSVLLVAPEKQQLVDDVDTRRECINTLTRRLSADRSRASQAQVLDAFRAARNWIVHGTPQENEWAKKAI